MRPIHGEVPGPRAGRPPFAAGHGLLACRVKEIRFDTKGERVLVSESDGICRDPCPGRLIENE